jgi:hypothetical protein
MDTKERKSRWAFVLMTLAMLMWMPRVSAQSFEYPEYSDGERIVVKCQGSRPAISDFVTAFLSHSKEREFYDKAYGEWLRFLQKKQPGKNVSIIVDTRNGYMHYEIARPEEKDTIVMEMCFWNCADGKRKLVCASTYWAMDGEYGWGEFTGVSFFLFDNKTRTMRTVLPEDIGALYDGDGISVFFLPRQGKDIRVSVGGGGDRWNEVLEWDGYQFHSKEAP